MAGTGTTRGGALRCAVALAMAAGLATGLAGCAGEPEPAAAAAPIAAPPPLVDTAPAPAQEAPRGKFVMIIRHGEKPGKKGSGPGVDAVGRESDNSLTSVGWQRARALAEALDGQGPTPPALTRPTAIYAAGAREAGKGIRTVETVQPLAEKIKVPVNTRFGKGEERALAQSAAAQPGPTLISWQHSEIPDLAASFGAVTPAPPKVWPDERYDVVWTLTATPTGWRFAQVPQMLMPGDQVATIGN